MSHLWVYGVVAEKTFSRGAIRLFAMKRRLEEGDQGESDGGTESGGRNSRLGSKRMRQISESSDDFDEQLPKSITDKINMSDDDLVTLSVRDLNKELKGELLV